MTKLRYIDAKPSKWICALLVFLVFIMYAFENSSLVTKLSSLVYNYIIKPMFWLGIAYFIWKQPSLRLKAKLRFKASINMWAFNFAIINIIITVIAGIFNNLGRSPYSHTTKDILINIVFVGSLLIGKEHIRAYIVNRLTKQENYIIFTLISIIMTFICFPISRYTELAGAESIMKFTAQYLAPEFSRNLLATYLAYIGGPLASIIYMGMNQAFLWLSPVLPDLQWLLAALVGIMCPVFSLAAMQNIYLKEAKLIKSRDMKKDSVFSWIVTSMISIAIVWFTVGVFPIYPSVIATGSMEPMIMPGDVILLRKITSIEQVKPDDVIQFRRDGILISHRVIEILEDEKNGIRYRTKGDNNSAPDSELVKPEDLKGKLARVVPKIGWPTLLIKSNRDIPLDEIEF